MLSVARWASRRLVQRVREARRRVAAKQRARASRKTPRSARIAREEETSWEPTSQRLRSVDDATGEERSRKSRL